MQRLSHPQTTWRMPASRYGPSQPPAGIPFAASAELTGHRVYREGACSTVMQTPGIHPGQRMAIFTQPWTDGEVNGGKGIPPLVLRRILDMLRFVGTTPCILRLRMLPLMRQIRLPMKGDTLSKPSLSRCVVLRDVLPARDAWEASELGCARSICRLSVLKPITEKTWHETKHTPAHPLFPEPSHFAGKVKIGAPHVVDFGQDMR